MIWVRTRESFLHEAHAGMVFMHIIICHKDDICHVSSFFMCTSLRCAAWFALVDLLSLYVSVCSTHTFET